MGVVNRRWVWVESMGVVVRRFVECMGVVDRRWVWVESMGVVVRRYIDFLIIITYPYSSCISSFW